jgi:hypothetical protein
MRFGLFDRLPCARIGRGTKQAVNIPLRQLAHSMMDLSLSLETQSNLSKDHRKQYGPSPRSGVRTSPASESLTQSLRCLVIDSH